MENRLLSIIVPAYNVELYVERCVNSLLNQSVDDQYEIIIINDGSTDGTKAVVESFEDAKIRVVNQENQGLSCARNVGFNIAKGEYVWFVDSDDWISKNAIQMIYEKITERPEVVALNYIECHDGINDRVNCYSKKPSQGLDLLFSGFNYPAQFYVYKKGFLSKNNLKFYPGIYHEDMEFTPRAIFLASHICYIDPPIYNYYIRSNSITTTTNPKRAFDYLIVSEQLVNFDKFHKGRAHLCFMRIVSRAICNAFLIMTQSPEIEKKRFVKCFQNHKYLYKVLLQSHEIKFFIRGVLLFLSGKYCISMYNWIMKFT